MNVWAFIAAEAVAMCGGFLLSLVAADAHAMRGQYRWTPAGLRFVAVVGALVGALAFYALGHVTVLCDLRSLHAAQSCTVTWL